ncbi:hypothetical protein [Sphingobacterium siyangense]|uniref:hypothetical protein n=1 Tax=Sphingobacterium TaxID=28453 RepID=UPI0008A24C95|nr:hypothetical protein [Sphingobacterium siyangense]MBB1642682.1 hypothetical protein [Sphingobacterium sp. UME9]OFV09546.1 hypothetical protein HMPREF3127_23045 [Sphingobacterium sp. HMSC13C05]
MALRSYHVLKVKKNVGLLLHFCLEHKLEKFVWKLLPFSFKQWHSWDGLKSCQFSLQGYCRKQNVAQLSLKEQQDKELGCAEKRVRIWTLVNVYYYLLRLKKVYFSLGAFTNIADS